MAKLQAPSPSHYKLPILGEARRKAWSLRSNSAYKADIDPKVAIRNILEDQASNAIYHDEKKKEEVIMARRGDPERATVPLPPTNSLDAMQKSRRCASMLSTIVAILGCVLLGLACLGLLFWTICWYYSPLVSYVYPPKAPTFGNSWIRFSNPRKPLGMLNVFPLFMGSWCYLSATFFRSQLLKQYFLLGPWLLGVPIFTIILSSHVFWTFVHHSPEKQLKNELYIYANKDVDTSIWDYIQLEFECCGLTSSNDWNLKDAAFFRVPYSCCPGSAPTAIRKRRRRKLQLSRKLENQADCPPYNFTRFPHMVENFTIPHVWHRGCLYMVIDHYNMIGAFTVTLAFSNLVVTVASMILGRACYVCQRQAEDSEFKYTCLETICDILCFRICIFVRNCRYGRGKSVAASEYQPDMSRLPSVGSVLPGVLPSIIISPLEPDPQVNQEPAEVLKKGRRRRGTNTSTDNDT